MTTRALKILMNSVVIIEQEEARGLAVPQGGYFLLILASFRRMILSISLSDPERSTGEKYPARHRGDDEPDALDALH